MNQVRYASTSLCAVVLACVVGCGAGPMPTSGLVQFDDGEIVKSGSVELRNLDTKESYSGKIMPSGSFVPRSKDGDVGVPPGKYECVVVQIVLTEDLALEAHMHGSTVPRRYADYHTSELRVSVADGDKDPIKITVENDDAKKKK